ncbi:hypothetical protein M153_100011004 [Pseudoloma neurophilia]|uniref:Uncharacterized protein n=1 Tax=Pseudoloma neurophilia TaxID=146866 RepID=A0A0R0M196_9MICR|nr:hypothetical protein M153_100011004 [Pseudoloma neurophilia]
MLPFQLFDFMSVLATGIGEQPTESPFDQKSCQSSEIDKAITNWDKELGCVIKRSREKNAVEFKNLDFSQVEVCHNFENNYLCLVEPLDCFHKHLSDLYYSDDNLSDVTGKIYFLYQELVEHCSMTILSNNHKQISNHIRFHIKHISKFTSYYNSIHNLISDFTKYTCYIKYKKKKLLDLFQKIHNHIKGSKSEEGAPISSFKSFLRKIERIESTNRRKYTVMLNLIFNTLLKQEKNLKEIEECALCYSDAFKTICSLFEDMYKILELCLTKLFFIDKPVEGKYDAKSLIYYLTPFFEDSLLNLIDRHETTRRDLKNEIRILHLHLENLKKKTNDAWPSLSSKPANWPYNNHKGVENEQ